MPHRERFRALIQDTSRPAFILTPAGETEACNQGAAAYLGLSGPEAGRWNWWWDIHPADLPTARRAWLRSVQTGAPHQVTYRLRRADGVYRWQVGQTTPVRGPDGQIARWVVTCRDLEEAPVAVAAVAAAC